MAGLLLRERAIYRVTTKERPSFVYALLEWKMSFPDEVKKDPEGRLIRYLRIILGGRRLPLPYHGISSMIMPWESWANGWPSMRQNIH